MFKPIEAKYQGIGQNMTMMARKGMNQEIFPPFQDGENAELIVNYFVDADGALIKRKGINALAEKAGILGYSFIVKWLNYIIVGYDTTVSVYNPVTATFTDVKTDFTAGSKLTGRAYGGYFFVNSSEDGLWRMSQILAYDNQTADFTVGRNVAGLTSGARGTILEDGDGGAAGVLTVGQITGVFQDDELIQGGAGGGATANGILGFAIDNVIAAPKGDIMEIIGPKMYIGAREADRTSVEFSNIDTGENPPFETWTVGTNSGDGGRIYNRTAGEVTRIDSIGQFVVVFYEDGKAAYTSNTVDSSGSLKRVDITQMDRRDMGGSGPSLSTPGGLFYVNEGGLHSLISIGQPNIDFSDQEVNHSVILGDEYFENIDFSNGSMMYDPKTQTLFVSCARNAVKNNLVIAFNMQNNAFTEITGWNIGDFYNDGGTFYGGSSVNGKLYELFTGSDDDGANIGTDFIQEIKLNGLTSRQDILKLYGNGQFWTTSNVTVSFNTFSRTGKYTIGEASFNWDIHNVPGSSEEYGSALFGVSMWGGGYSGSGSINDFNGCSPMLRNVQRAKIRIQSNDASPHVINFFQITTRSKAPIRVRKMSRN